MNFTAQSIYRQVLLAVTLAWPFSAAAHPACPGVVQPLDWRTAETLHQAALKDPNVGTILAATEQAVAADGYRVIGAKTPDAADGASSSGNQVELLLHRVGCDGPIDESDVARLVVRFAEGEDGTLRFNSVAFDYLGRQPI